MAERMWKLKKSDGTYMRGSLTGDEMTFSTREDAARCGKVYLTVGYSIPVLIEYKCDWVEVDV